MTFTLEELKEYIIEHYDPDELLEILDLSTEDLVEAFEDKIIEQRWKFDGYKENDDEEEIQY